MIISLCALALLLAAAAFAADGATVYTESSESAATEGDEFSYTISLSGTYDGFSLDVSDIDGLSVQSVTPASSNINVDLIGGKYQISVLPGYRKNDAPKELIATVSVKVDSGAAEGERTISVSDILMATEYGDPVSPINKSFAKVKIGKKASEQPCEIEPLKVLDENFDELPSIPSGAFYAEASVKNNSSSERIIVILASFGKDGRLIETRYLYGNVEIGRTLTFGSSFTNADGNTEKIKAFVWSSLKTMTPLAEAVETE